MCWAGGPSSAWRWVGRAVPAAAAPIVEDVVIVELGDDEDFGDLEEDLAPAHEPAAEGASGDDDDIEGARLIALNMALNGQSRDETDKYLAENFDLSDRGALLDEVYATVE